MTVAETRDYALRRGPVSPRPSLSPPLPWRPENLRPATLRQASAASSRWALLCLYARDREEEARGEPPSSPPLPAALETVIR